MGHQWGLVLLLVIVMLTSASDESASPPALEMAQVAISTPTPKARDPKPTAPPAAPGRDLLASRRLAVPVQGIKRRRQAARPGLRRAGSCAYCRATGAVLW